MSGNRISDLTAIVNDLAGGDLFYVTDISDTTDDSAGTSKKITATEVSTFVSSSLATSVLQQKMVPDFYSAVFTNAPRVNATNLTNEQILCIPVTIPAAITIQYASCAVANIAGGGSVSIGLYSADKATRYCKTNWTVLGAGINTVQMASPGIVTNPGTYIAAFSLKFSGSIPTFYCAAIGITTAAQNINHIVGARVVRSGINSLLADDIIALPSSLDTITNYNNMDFPVINLSGE